jgi:hypothetical protein
MLSRAVDFNTGKNSTINATVFRNTEVFVNFDARAVYDKMAW